MSNPSCLVDKTDSEHSCTNAPGAGVSHHVYRQQTEAWHLDCWHTGGSRRGGITFLTHDVMDRHLRLL